MFVDTDGFASDRARLDWLLWRLGVLFESRPKVELKGESLTSLVVCVSLFQRALSMAEGVNLLVTSTSSTLPLLSSEQSTKSGWTSATYFVRQNQNSALNLPP